MRARTARLKGMTISDPCAICGDVRRVKPGPKGTTCATCILPELGMDLPSNINRLRRMEASISPKQGAVPKDEIRKLLETIRAEIDAHPSTTRPVPEQQLADRLAEIKHLRESCAKRHADDIPYRLLRAAQSRAAKRQIPCTIRRADIAVPTHCPVLGIELATARGKRRDNSPTLDRIIPHLGYVPGNIAVISYKANTIKSFGTAEEHEKIAAWIRANDNSWLYI